MYCPVCFAESLNLTSTGVIHLSINGKHMDTSRFLYNLKSQSKKELLASLRDELDKLFKWYASFHNKHPVIEIFLTTSNAVCNKNCRVPAGSQFSVIDIIFTRDEVKAITNELMAKYKIMAQSKFDSE